MLAVRSKAVIEMLQTMRLDPVVARAFDTAAAEVAQDCVPVYRAHLQEILWAQQQAKKSKRKDTGVQDIAAVLTCATKPLERIEPKRPPKPTLSTEASELLKAAAGKSRVVCIKCKNRNGAGVLRIDKTVRSADEGAGVKYECLDEACRHVWIKR
jgi:DNA-directed RNA polymerase subunit M/transcription elongation factor TFIIS